MALPGPEVTVHDLMRAAQVGDRDAVFELLTPATQARLSAEAQRAIDLNGASIRYTAKDMISVGSTNSVAAPSDIAVVEQRGDRATVEIIAPAGRSRLSLEKSNGKWRVDLPGYGR